MADNLEVELNKSKSILYLHIGMPKTGTSTIQFILTKNEKLLYDRDVVYPKNTRYGKDDYPNAHHNLGDSLISGKLEIWEILEDELLKEIYGKKIIISSEVFSNLHDLNKIEWLKNYFYKVGLDNVKIIVYLRRQDDFLQSIYQTMVYNNLITETFSEYYNIAINDNLVHKTLDYYFIVNNLWAKCFGKKNIIVRPYEKSQLHNQSLILDFFKCLDVGLDDSFDLSRANKGISLDLCSLELYRNIKNMYPGNESYLLEIRKRLLESNTRKEFSSNNIITKKQSEKIMQLVKESNNKVAKEYLEREDGILFEENDSANLLFGDNEIDIQNEKLIKDYTEKLIKILMPDLKNIKN